MDCDTGGYNLQMAFSTGALAAENAAKQTNEARDKEGKEQNGERERKGRLISSYQLVSLLHLLLKINIS